MAVGGKANSKGQGEAPSSGVTDIFQRFNCDYCQVTKDSQLFKSNWVRFNSLIYLIGGYPRSTNKVC